MPVLGRSIRDQAGHDARDGDRSPPTEVESALAAINTAHNQVSSEHQSCTSLQLIRKSSSPKRAVEIETLKAQAEVQLLNQMSQQLLALKASGTEALKGYLRNVRLNLYSQASRVIWEDKND